ncbi:heavy metal transport/detoxification protein [candidate division SR1 bacterium RAAC1_SR1_1]|nr:heavy metal transport/detoxification protein [candidate division SR1 bacterium RAAC1_SR1_1]
MKKTIYIKGMHCASCEMIIKDRVENIKGVQVENISAKNGKLDLEIVNENLLKKINEEIKKAGYTSTTEPTQPTEQNKKIGTLIIASIVILLLVLLGNKLNIAQHIPSGDGKISYGIALLTGLIASVSTCLAIVGSIVLGFGAYADNTKGTKGLLKTHLSFHAGRIGGFFVGGAILGLLGQTFSLSLNMTSMVTIIVGIIVVRMGLYILKIVPSISSFGVHLPKKRTEKILTTKNPLFAPIVGALTFFLPCGFTLSMQLVAITSGNPLQGGLIMAIFALGTMPVLFALGLGSSYIKEKKFTLLHTIIGAIIIFFGIFMINNGRTLLGTAPQKPVQEEFSSNIAYETIHIEHDGYQTIPEKILLQAGKNYELIITPNSNGRGCMVNMLIPKLDRTIRPIKKDLPIVYRFTNIQKGQYAIVCGTMGMYQGQILVQ